MEEIKRRMHQFIFAIASSTFPHPHVCDGKSIAINTKKKMNVNKHFFGGSRPCCVCEVHRLFATVTQKLVNKITTDNAIFNQAHAYALFGNGATLSPFIGTFSNIAKVMIVLIKNITTIGASGSVRII